VMVNWDWETDLGSVTDWAMGLMDFRSIPHYQM
jgi:hypothetical protein